MAIAPSRFLSSLLRLSAQPGSEGEEIEYDAFISYHRSSADDRKWAVWLQEELERYRTPNWLVRHQGRPAKLRRVFLDDSELRAADILQLEIARRLKQSRFLVVICSPDAESEWINWEIETFNAGERGNDRQIIPFLICGEPSIAFPSALRKLEAVGVSGADQPPGGIGLNLAAADVRPRVGESARATRKVALLQVIAPILGCQFDDLRGREQIRKMRRLHTLAGVLAAFLIAVLITALAYRAQRNDARAERDHSRKLLAESDLAKGMDLIERGQAAQGLAHLHRTLELDPSNSTGRDVVAATLIARKWPVLRAVVDSPGWRAIGLSRDGKFALAASEAKLRVESTDGSAIGPEFKTGADPKFIRLSGNGKFVVTIGQQTGAGHPKFTLSVWEGASGNQSWSVTLDGIPHLLKVDNGRRILMTRQTLGETNEFALGVIPFKITTADASDLNILSLGEQGAMLSVATQSVVEYAELDPDGQSLVADEPDVGLVRRSILDHNIGPATVLSGRPGQPVAVDSAGNFVMLMGGGDCEISDRSGSPLDPPFRKGGIKSAHFTGDAEDVLTISTAGAIQIWSRAGVPKSEPVIAGAAPMDGAALTNNRLVAISAAGISVWDLPVQAAVNTPLTTAPALAFAARFVTTERIRAETANGTASWAAADGSLIEDSELPSSTFWDSPDLLQPVSDPVIVPDGGADIGKSLEEHSNWRGLGTVHSIQFGTKAALGVALVTSDNDVRLLDVATGQTRGVPLIFSGPVHAAQFSPDEGRFVVSSDDGISGVWDVRSRRPIGPAFEHNAAVWSAAFSPDGQRVVTASADGSLRIWDTPHPDASDVPTLLHLTEALGGISLGDEDVSVPAPLRDRLVTATLFQEGTKSVGVRRLAAWLFADSRQRTISPYSSVKAEERVPRDLAASRCTYALSIKMRSYDELIAELNTLEAAENFLKNPLQNLLSGIARAGLSASGGDNPFRNEIVIAPNKAGPADPPDQVGDGTVESPLQCEWKVESTVDWIVIAGNATRRGPGSFRLKTQRNKTPERRAGLVRVGERTVELVQPPSRR
jgi:WD40 repeat protein